MAETGQDQHLKLRSQSHIFLKVFFDKKHGKPFAGTHFFSDLPLSKFWTESCPQAEKGGLILRETLLEVINKRVTLFCFYS